jgi:uncharacterized membrane protein YhaH (DUF805 family)
MENPYAPPKGKILAPPSNDKPLPLTYVLFSLKGRIPRRSFWVANILIVCVGAVTGDAMTHLVDEPSASTIVQIPLLWFGLAIGVKRWHDRDKGGQVAWILTLFYGVMIATGGTVMPEVLLPVFGILGLWTFVECGCLRGTVGPNKYGEDLT